MSKFKVGDEVVLKENLVGGTIYGGVYFIGNMLLNGKSRITFIGNNYVELEHKDSLYSEEMLELAEESPKEYLIEDVIRLMRENSDRKFRPSTSDYEDYIYLDVDNQSINWKNGAVKILSNINVLWTEYIPEEPIKPMSFGEIVEIISENGNDYKVELFRHDETQCKDYFDNVISELSLDYGSTVISKYILEGEWYLIDKETGNRVNYDK